MFVCVRLVGLVSQATMLKSQIELWTLVLDDNCSYIWGGNKISLSDHRVSVSVFGHLNQCETGTF